MIIPIREAKYGEVQSGDLLFKSKKSEWFIGRSLCIVVPSTSFGYILTSLSKDNMLCRNFKNKTDAIEQLISNRSEGEVFISTNPKDLADLVLEDFT